MTKSDQFSKASSGVVTGKMLIEWGLKPGKHFAKIIQAANATYEHEGSLEAARLTALSLQPSEKIRMKHEDPALFVSFLDGIDGDATSWTNLGNVERDMRALMALPTVHSGLIMPDACPAGVIPVGGVVRAQNAIHPGMHSADICCSVMVTYLDSGVDQKALLDAAHNITHFGGGGRNLANYVLPPKDVLDGFEQNPLLRDLGPCVVEHFATQGDGNHFLYVGRSRSTGEVALVTHHGSRRPGAMLYKKGMKIAESMTRDIAEGVPSGMAWIPASSNEGEEYWDALQQVRKWTRANHEAIHDMATRELFGRKVVEGRFWNEHNFVFRSGSDNNLFEHAKGATPLWRHAPNDPLCSNLRIIPMNMSEPILIVKAGLWDFGPHGAGRTVSRSAHMRDWGFENGEEELESLRSKGLDVRFWHGTPDASELPSAYKDANFVRNQMEKYNLAEIVDYIDPYGCIMAGNWTLK